MGKKGIRIDYYEVWAYEKIDNNNYKENKFDISNIFDSLQELDIADRTFDYSGEKIRFQKVEYDSENKLWEVQILRARSMLAPGVADDSGNYSFMQLDDGKYYAESISLCYYREKCIVALQVNHNYITKSVLQQIFNKLQKELTQNIELRPIIIQAEMEKIEKAKFFTRLSVVVKKQDSQLLSPKETLLGELLRSANKYSGSQVKIEVGFGRNLKKKDTLDSKMVLETLSSVNAMEGVEEAQIDYKTTADSIVDTLSLTNERIIDWIYIQTENLITHEDIIPKMKEKIINRIKDKLI